MELRLQFDQLENKLEKVLNDKEITMLRESGIISKEEIAISVGDLVVAENVCTRDRRVIDATKILSESKRRVLKG